MKGQASPDTLTGKVQSALTDEYQMVANIGAAIPGGLTDSEWSNLRHVLERLTREGRAEQQFVLSSAYMAGGYAVYRATRPAESGPPASAESSEGEPR